MIAPVAAKAAARCPVCGADGAVFYATCYTHGEPEDRGNNLVRLYKTPQRGYLASRIRSRP